MKNQSKVKEGDELDFFLSGLGDNDPDDQDELSTAQQSRSTKQEKVSELPQQRDREEKTQSGTASPGIDESDQKAVNSRKPKKKKADPPTSTLSGPEASLSGKSLGQDTTLEAEEDALIDGPLSRFQVRTSAARKTSSYTSVKIDKLLQLSSTMLNVGKAQFLENIIRAHFNDYRQEYQSLHEQWIKDQKKSPF